jgi:hypothetical protein
MTPNDTRSAVALALCALSDLGAVPLLVSTKGGPPAAIGVLVAALGVLTAAAAFGLARKTRWARSLAWMTRIVDGLAALPAVGAGNGTESVAAAVTILLSVIAIVFLIREASGAPSSAQTSASAH